MIRLKMYTQQLSDTLQKNSEWTVFIRNFEFFSSISISVIDIITSMASKFERVFIVHVWRNNFADSNSNINKNQVL